MSTYGGLRQGALACIWTVQWSLDGQASQRQSSGSTCHAATCHPQMLLIAAVQVKKHQRPCQDVGTVESMHPDRQEPVQQPSSFCGSRFSPLCSVAMYLKYACSVTAAADAAHMGPHGSSSRSLTVSEGDVIAAEDRQDADHGGCDNAVHKSLASVIGCLPLISPQVLRFALTAHQATHCWAEIGKHQTIAIIVPYDAPSSSQVACSLGPSGLRQMIPNTILSNGSKSLLDDRRATP